VATLTVWKFPTAQGAEEAQQTLEMLQKQELIKIHDAAVVTWSEGAKKPKTRQLNNLAGIGAMGGMFWGMLFGLIFVTPFFGLAVGAAFGAIGGAFRDYGIDDDFIKGVRGAVTPGTSALFLMTSNAVLDRVVKAMKVSDFEIIATNLSSQQERRLRELFAQ
jgi:uncharacterized membrane protein